MRTPDLGRDERAPFPAKITARTSSGGRYYYSWTEQVDAPAGYMDAAPARSGNATMNPAFEVNNASVSTGAYVRMWLRSGQGGGGRCYEFAAPVPAAIGYTDATHDGIISLSDQVIGDGLKSFQDGIRHLTTDATCYVTEVGNYSGGTARVRGTVTVGSVDASYLQHSCVLGASPVVSFVVAGDAGGSAFGTAPPQINFTGPKNSNTATFTLSQGGLSAGMAMHASAPYFFVNSDFGATATVSGLVFKGGIYVSGGLSGVGTVTSVGLSLPSIFTVTVTPVTSSGTLTATLNTQSANLVFAGPASGGPAAPAFRALEAADLPAQAGGWVTITLSYINFSTGSTTHIYTPSTLPAKTVVHAVVVRTTTAFSGGAIGAYNLDVGLSSGSGTEWCSGYDVMAAPSGTNFNFHPGSGATGVLPALLNPVSGVNIAITANCVGANLNAATQGTVEVSLFLSRLP